MRALKDRFKKFIPESSLILLRKYRAKIPGFMPTVSVGWDKYAKKYNGAGHLGEEWNRPDLEGLGIRPEEFVSYIEQAIIDPYINNVSRILEIGSGGGRFTEVLLPRTKSLIASDTSTSMLRLVKKRFGDEPKLSFCKLDGMGLGNIEDESIDIAFSYGVFVHLQHWDIYNYLIELNRVLRPDGTAIIQHGNSFSDAGWKYFVDEVKIQLNAHKLFSSYSFMTPEIMAEFIRRAGFDSVICKTDVVQTEAISIFKKSK